MADCLAFGKKGEDQVIQYLLSQDYSLGLVDVRAERAAQQADVDFLLLRDNDVLCSIEVKTDSYSSGNMFFEEKSDETRDGCMVVTKADYLFYFFINESVLYIIRIKPFRKWYERNKRRFRYIPQVKNETPGWKPYAASGRLIPRKVLERECSRFVVKKENLSSSQN